jgi:hypothetical protein
MELSRKILPALLVSTALSVPVAAQEVKDQVNLVSSNVSTVLKPQDTDPKNGVKIGGNVDFRKGNLYGDGYVEYPNDALISAWIQATSKLTNTTLYMYDTFFPGRRINRTALGLSQELKLNQETNFKGTLEYGQENRGYNYLDIS